MRCCGRTAGSDKARCKRVAPLVEAVQDVSYTQTRGRRRPAPSSVTAQLWSPLSFGHGSALVTWMLALKLDHGTYQQQQAIETSSEKRADQAHRDTEPVGGRCHDGLDAPAAGAFHQTGSADCVGSSLQEGFAQRAILRLADADLFHQSSRQGAKRNTAERTGTRQEAVVKTGPCRD